jgi:hypothetical protein
MLNFERQYYVFMNNNFINVTIEMKIVLNEVIINFNREIILDISVY